MGHRGGLPHFLYGKVFCGECGEPMTRRTVNGVGGVKCKTWICRQNRGKKVCAGKNIKEENLLAKINQQLGWEQLDEEQFLRDVERVDINGKEITVYENNTKEMAG